MLKELLGGKDVRKVLGMFFMKEAYTNTGELTSEEIKILERMRKSMIKYIDKHPREDAGDLANDWYRINRRKIESISDELRANAQIAFDFIVSGDVNDSEFNPKLGFKRTG